MERQPEAVPDGFRHGDGDQGGGKEASGNTEPGNRHLSIRIPHNRRSWAPFEVDQVGPPLEVPGLTHRLGIRGSVLRVTVARLEQPDAHHGRRN